MERQRSKTPSMKLKYWIPLAAVLSGTAIAWKIAPVISATFMPSVRAEPIEIAQAGSATDSNVPTGGLFVAGEDGEEQVFPLKHTDVRSQITGNVARVEVTQKFTNPFDEPIEAVYVFPLPDEAAVDDMEILVGDKIIKGVIKRREEAREIYERAIAEGRTAGLLEQERANIFTQSLANIRPGEDIDVTIRYTESLAFEGGNYEFVFPMVVGPRFVPGAPIDRSGNTDRVPDADRINPPVLKPGERSGHDINVTVEIDAGVPISKIHSTSHAIDITENGGKAEVKLANNDTIPNKDLILRYQVAGKETQATILTQKDEKGGHFAVYLIPAVDYEKREIVPKDVVFLIDTSGSQSGAPIAQSKVLMRRFIDGLNPNDTFTVVDFSNTAQALSPAPLPNTAANRRKALQYVEALDANGGTQLLNGIQAVLNFPEPEAGRLRSVVLLTDGYIGNEAEIIAEVQEELKPGNRLYGFGVGSSVNRFLLDRMAEAGRGTVQVIRHDEEPTEVVDRFFRQINNPVLTRINATWQGNGETPEIYPLAAPDLFAEQPLVLFGRKPDAQNGRLEVKGVAAGGREYREVFDVGFDGAGNVAIAQLWGRAKIKDLANQMYRAETTSGVEAITQTALAYRLLSQYTAFVAVSEEVRVDPDGTTRRVEVPVELPDGTSYEGIFGSDDEAEILEEELSVIQRCCPLPSGPPPIRSAPPAESAGRVRDFDGVDTESEAMEEEEPRLEIVRADGLDAKAIADLDRHLRLATIAPDVEGEMVLELHFREGRTDKVLLDDVESTLTDIDVLNELKRLFLSWQPPASVGNKLRVTVRIRKL